MNVKRLIVWSIIGTGISSVATQLITVREFLSQFSGNEIVISIVIFCWLLLTGLGSLAAKAVKRASLSMYGLLILCIAVWPLLQTVMIRVLRSFYFTHGISPGFYSIFSFVALTIAPYCLLAGFILPFSQKALISRRYSFKTGELYITDSVGDITGGILFSFFLVYWLKPFPTLAVTSTLLLMVSLALLNHLKRYGFLSAGLMVALFFYFGATNGQFESNTLTHQYGDIIRYTESPYGRIVVSREGPQHTFWGSGIPFYSDMNVMSSEEKVHYPLCQLEDVENVLLVSGGLGETMKEISKYKPKHIDYVELDPYLTDVALDLGAIKMTPHIKIINTDARRYINETDNRYNAVIMDLPDPDNFQINRFFTKEFFYSTKRILAKDGIISMSIEYSPNYISDIRKKKLSTLYNTAKLHFSNVMLLPGEEAYFLCRDGELWKDIPARLKKKSISTSYIEDYFYGNITKQRIDQLEESIDIDAPINKDFEPRLMNILFMEWFTKHGTSPNWFFIGLILFALVYVIFMQRVEYVLFCTGMATMGVEMLVVFAFQVIYGYIYLEIGAIVTAFLLGLLPGAIIGNSWQHNEMGKLAASELMILTLLFLYLVWIHLFQSALNPVCFLIYCFFFSFLSGFQFPIAARTVGEKRSPAAGILAADLCGAALGTLLTGAVLIPLWGMRSAVIFLIFIKISSGLTTFYISKTRT